MKKLLSLFAILGLLAFVATPIYAQEEDAVLDDEAIVAEAEDIAGDADVEDTDAEDVAVDDVDEEDYALETTDEDAIEGSFDLEGIEDFNDIFENEDVQAALDEAGLTNEEAA
jgi:hypothetical protein